MSDGWHSDGSVRRLRHGISRSRVTRFDCKGYFRGFKYLSQSHRFTNNEQHDGTKYKCGILLQTQMEQNVKPCFSGKYLTNRQGQNFTGGNRRVRGAPTPGGSGGGGSAGDA